MENPLAVQTSDLVATSSGLRVLLIDDDEEYAFLVQKMLDEAGVDWELDWRASWEEGLEAVLSEDYHACIVDQQIGRGGLGTELVRQAAREVHTPFLMLTSANQRDLDIEALRSGASQFLTKDALSPESLERAVRYAVAVASRGVRSAMTDDLTGLENRAGLEGHFRRASARARREGTGLALLLEDLDGFKAVNDQLGHNAGDEVLRVAARRLLQSVRPYDVVARTGGDEFVVLLTRADTDADALRVAQRVVEQLGQPYGLSPNAPEVTGSVGLTTFDGTSSYEYVSTQADEAMYAAKRRGRNQVVRYQTSLEVADKIPANLGEMRRAAELGELALFLQPVVDLASGRVLGAEALMRWGPGGQWMPTEPVVAELERNMAIVDLDRWMITEADRWVEQNQDLGHIAVNVAPISMLDARFVGDLDSCRAKRIRLEITERQPSFDMARTRSFVEQARRRGFQILLDDFGCGHSSLTRLRALDVDGIKIDRCFVRDLDPEKAREGALVAGLRELARQVGIDVVVEGVETAFQRKFLKGCGFTQGQGYWFSKPLPAIELANVLHEPLGLGEEIGSTGP